MAILLMALGYVWQILKWILVIKGLCPRRADPVPEEKDELKQWKQQQNVRVTLMTLTVEELKAECAKRDLRRSGLKQDLIERIMSPQGQLPLDEFLALLVILKNKSGIPFPREALMEKKDLNEYLKKSRLKVKMGTC